MTANLLGLPKLPDNVLSIRFSRLAHSRQKWLSCQLIAHSPLFADVTQTSNANSDTSKAKGHWVFEPCRSRALST